jgi:hypothetical protein
VGIRRDVVRSGRRSTFGKNQQRQRYHCGVQSRQSTRTYSLHSRLPPTSMSRAPVTAASGASMPPGDYRTLCITRTRLDLFSFTTPLTVGTYRSTILLLEGDKGRSPTGVTSGDGRLRIWRPQRWTESPSNGGCAHDCILICVTDQRVAMAEPCVDVGNVTNTG